jgi:hypothetical protein
MSVNSQVLGAAAVAGGLVMSATSLTNHQTRDTLIAIAITLAAIVVLGFITRRSTRRPS